MRTMTWLAALLSLSACSTTSPERRLIDDTVRAVGGRSAIEAASSVVLEGEGENFNLGQNKNPEGDLPVYKVTAFKRTVDLAGARWRQEQLRTPQFPASNPSPQRQILGLDGEVAYNIAPDGTATRASESVARDRRIELGHSPLFFLRMAMAEGAKLGTVRTHENHGVLDVTSPEGVTYTLSVDTGTKMPTSITSMTSNPLLGDVAVETTFDQYRDFGGLKLPTLMVSTLDKYQTARIRVTKASVNSDMGDLAAPAAARSAPAAPPVVTVEELDTGVWYLAGQSHHSIVVEFADHLTLIEAPLEDARTLAVITRARELRPAKPLTEVINTHHHFDHSGGVRAAVSEGLRLITHQGNRSFFEDVFRRRHAIAPDAWERNQKPLQIETVEGEGRELKDASMTVALYPVTNSPHCDTTLMAYFPKGKLLVEVDEYSPPAANATIVPKFPFAPNLLDNIRRRNLEVHRVVPLHSRIVPFADLVAAAESERKTTD